LLAGLRLWDDGYFIDIGFGTAFWSSTESGAVYAGNPGLNYYNNNFSLLYDRKEYGFSVRCLKD